MRVIPSRSSTSPDCLFRCPAPDCRAGSAVALDANLATTVSLGCASEARRRNSPRPVVVAAPRSVEQRILHTRKRLELDIDAWVATSGPDRPWLVPLSFLLYHDRLLFATSANSPTVVNIARVALIRVALDGVRDVVIVDGQAELESSTALSSDEIQAYLNKHGSDPRTWADTVIALTPTRIQAWREENEIAGRTIMRNGAWVCRPS